MSGGITQFAEGEPNARQEKVGIEPSAQNLAFDSSDKLEPEKLIAKLFDYRLYFLSGFVKRRIFWGVVIAHEN